MHLTTNGDSVDTLNNFFHEATERFYLVQVHLLFSFVFQGKIELLLCSWVMCVYSCQVNTERKKELASSVTENRNYVNSNTKIFLEQHLVLFGQ